MSFYTGAWNKSTRLFVLGYENGTTIALQMCIIYATKSIKRIGSQ